jgi:NhaA family Na+:H+ antiporter
MEIKHEIVHGELSDIRNAALPIVGALGGMIVPALLFVLLNFGRPGQHGWGVPMATDIAFSLGVLGMVKGIPSELKVFLLTLAIADDIGAIIVIAFFFFFSLHVQDLFVVLILLFLFFVLLYRHFMSHHVCSPGDGFWVAILQSGIPPPSSSLASWYPQLPGFHSNSSRTSVST